MASTLITNNSSRFNFPSPKTSDFWRGNWGRQPKGGLFKEPGYAIAKQKIDHLRLGNVTFNYDNWIAKLYPSCEDTVLPGQEVKVVGREGSILWVTPLEYILPHSTSI